MNLIDEVTSIIPPLDNDTHKGQAGRIGIFGGSEIFTGAPYFAATSALKVGADLVYVFCAKDAAQVIKSYDPELIVYPILDSDYFVQEVSEVLPRLHSLVIGPGLGRQMNTFVNIRHLSKLAQEKDIPVVYDADSLFHLDTHPELVKSNKKAILTPNKMEFSRMYQSFFDKQLAHDAKEEDVAKVAQFLGNVTVVCKGPSDIISNGVTTVLCKETGSARRCGGQGDLLSGSMGVFNFWAHDFYEQKGSKEMGLHDATILAAFGACVLTRKCNFLAFQKFQRSMISTNMIAEIHSAFSSLFYKLF